MSCRHLLLPLLPLLAFAPGAAALPPAPGAEPEFEPIPAAKRGPDTAKAVPAPVAYGIEASIDGSGRVALRCKAGEAPAYRRWRESLAAPSRRGARE